jgi:hypothetical protein
MAVEVPGVCHGTRPTKGIWIISSDLAVYNHVTTEVAKCLPDDLIL